MMLVVFGCISMHRVHSGETETVKKDETLFEKGKKVVTAYGPKVVEAGKTLLKKDEPAPVSGDDVDINIDSSKIAGTASDTLSLADDIGAVVIGPITTRDIIIGQTEVTTCNQNVASTCKNVGSCNTTIGTCKYTQQQAELNAAPSEISFERYLTANTHAKTLVIPGNPVPLELTKENNFTQVINVPDKNISYMIMILPTNPSFVDRIKNLPKGLARYLKTETDDRDIIVKIYVLIGNSTVWTEVLDQKIDVKYTIDGTLPIGHIIDKVKIGLDGSLMVTFYNVSGPVGVIRELNVTYQPF
jgi:hypothetical protein